MDTSVYPIARNPVMICGSAATVCERSPPPSWRSTTAPGNTAPSTRLAIAAAPGNVQSFGSTE